MFSGPTKLESEQESVLIEVHPGRASLVDLLFLSVLQIVAACVLFTHRGLDWIAHGSVIVYVAVAWLAIAAAWLLVKRRSKINEHASTVTPSPGGRVLSDRNSLIRFACVFVFLLAFTLIAFSLPLTINFWHGYDDSDYLDKASKSAALLMMECDATGNRFFTYVYSSIATWLCRDSLDGFLCLATAIKFAHALVLYSILRLLLPNQRALWLMASVLLIVNPAEPLRYMMIIMGGYYFTPMRLLLAMTLFLYSYLNEARWLLIISTLLLATCVLTNEATFPLAIAAPALLLLVAKPLRPNFWPWVFAWTGTVAIGAFRLFQFLLNNRDSYQVGIGSKMSFTVPGLMNDLMRCIMPTFSSFSMQGLKEFWGYGLTVALLAFVIMWLFGKQTIYPSTRRPYFVGLIVSAIAIVLGVIPFCVLKGILRTQFFAASAQATLWALTIALGASFAPKAYRRWLEISLCVVLVAIAAAGSMLYQKTVNVDIRFEKIVHIFQGIRSIAPEFASDTLIVFVLPPGVPSPFGANYSLQRLSRIEFSVNGIQSGDYNDSNGEQAHFGSDGIMVPSSYAEKPNQTPINHGGPVCVDYDRLVVVSLSSSGDVTLLKELPKSLLPEDAHVERYNPSARILSHKRPAPFKFMHLSSWMTPYRPASEAVTMGKGFYQAEQWNGETFRWANNDAEVLFHRQADEISFLIEGGPSLSGSKAQFPLVVLDDNGDMIGRMIVKGRQNVTFKLPSNLKRIRLRVESTNRPKYAKDPRVLNFRIFNLEVR